MRDLHFASGIQIDKESSIVGQTRDLASLAGETTIFGGFATEKVKRLQTELDPLSRRYDVVVANPPYMGSSNMNSWLSGWTKKRYKEVCKDLCTCFIKRGFSLSDDRGYEALITSDTCMYISSFEKMRREVIERTSIVCFIDTRGTNAHPDVFDANAGWVLWNHPCANIKGSYFKLNHPIPEKGQRLLEALANPNCGWYYRTDASSFDAIPGSPIAYWASEAVVAAFANMESLGKRLITREGMATADNDRFIRQWFECSLKHIDFNHLAENPAKAKWYPYEKGGEYRKWYGNRELVVDWEDDGYRILHNYDIGTGRLRSHNYNGDYAFRRGITWSSISSAVIHVRWSPDGELFDSKGAKGFAQKDSWLLYAMALINSSFASMVLLILAPTIDFKVGDIIEIPDAGEYVEEIAKIVKTNINLSRNDWDWFEVSWDFARHPLL